MRNPLLLCPFVFVAVALPSQATHLVGAGGFAEIRQALTVAQPGDRILVDPGVYAHFRVAVGVTIRALVPGSVDVRYDPAYQTPGCFPFCGLIEGPTEFSVPVGQEAHVVGLRFLPTIHTGSNFIAYHRVVVGAGLVHFEECTLQAANSAALTVQPSSQVHFNRSTALGIGSSLVGADGVLVNGGSLTAVGSLIQGTGGGVQNQSGAGVQCNGGTVHLSGCALVSVASMGIGAVLPALNGHGWAWLHGCSLQGGGCAVTWSGVSPDFDDCTFTSPTNCGIPTGPFPSLVGAEQLDPLLLGASASQVWHTDPNGLLLLVASYGLGQTPQPGVLVEPSWLDQGSWFLVGVFSADAAGQLATSIVVPNVPQLSDSEFWLGAASWPVFPLRASPPVGGVIR